MNEISFGSDNHSRVHPKIMAAIIKANEGYATAYGEDTLTDEVTEKIKKLFGGNGEVFFTLTGTGANVLALQSLLKSYHSIICSDTAHINVDECGAVQKLTQARLIPIKTTNGKLSPELIKPLLTGRGDEHRSQKRIISISQTTELGTVYSIKELQELADFAHNNELFLHIDGARFANAAATLNVSPVALTSELGVDIVSFGGTKNGMMFGEAVISFCPHINNDILFYRKQITQLFSKMRYISAQYKAYLQEDLWLKNASQANRMAQLLSEKLSQINGISIVQKVESNAVFASFPSEITPNLQDKYHFYVWDEETNVVRLMCSFDTKIKHIENFITDVKKALV